VLLKIHLEPSDSWTFSGLSESLQISASEVHGALKRAGFAQLYSQARRQVRIHNLREFLEYGMRYAFPAQPGPMARGLPTAWSTAPLLGRLGTAAGPLLVWPDPRGEVDGLAIRPLYPTVPAAVRQDSRLYEILALLDGLRLGRSRERAIATEELSIRLAPVTTREIRPAVAVLSMPQKMADRIVALRARGPRSPYESKELEDLVGMLDRGGRLVEEITASDAETKKTIADWARGFLSDPEHTYLLEEHLPRGPGFEARLDLVMSRLTRLSTER
jgi:hypothetical protein